MATVLRMRAFPVASELFSPLSSRPGGSTNSLQIPRSAKSSATSAMLQTLVTLVCFALGLYIAVQMYVFALGMMDSRLPKAFAVCFGAGYVLQLFVGWLEFREEQRWREEARKELEVR